jgi:hypothetical protein
MFIVHLHYTDHRVPSTKCRNPKPETRKYVHNMSIFHSLHKSPSLSAKTRNSKPSVQHVHFSFTLHKSSSAECRVPSAEFRVPSAENRSPRPENMYATFPFFTCCTNHRVSSAETQNSKPGVQHVHCSFILHRSLSSEC